MKRFQKVRILKYAGIMLVVLLSFVLLSGSQNMQGDQNQEPPKTLSKFFDHYTQDGLVINNIKHIDQRMGKKDGIWIETDDRFRVWFYTYNMGLKDGVFGAYSLTNGRLELEGTYDKGKITGILKIFDAYGNIYSEYNNIKYKINEKKITEMPSIFDQLVIKQINIGKNKTMLKFHYEAGYKKYTVEGKVYKTGNGVFNEDKSYFEQDGKWYSCDSKLFRIYDL